ncbi:MAG: nuclear transport factor 2 family protein [Actinomycetota bacterium]
MSEENIELINRAADAFNRHDLDAFVALFDPDVEFSSRIVELERGRPYRGHDGIRSWWKDVFGVFPDLSAETEEIRDLGDMTITQTKLRGQGIGSAAPTEQRQWIVSVWRHKKAISWRAFGSKAEALEAAGLKE